MTFPLDPIARVQQETHQSQLVQAVALLRGDGGVRFALGKDPLRALSAGEIQYLEGAGNAAEDWSRIRVSEGFDPRKVRHCIFSGEVTLGRLKKMVTVAPGIQLPSGVTQAVLANCIVGHNVYVHNSMLSSCVVGSGAVISGCEVTGGETAFANGQFIPVGIEVGGRDVGLFAELDIAAASRLARGRGDRSFLEEYQAALKQYVRNVQSSRTIISPGAVLKNTPKIQQAYVGPGACIDGAASVCESTILSSAAEPTRIESCAMVMRSILQWGSRVASGAMVEGSLLTEHSQVERQGKVVSSILGPNTHVAQGEVNACLLGPFVAFHHQALLIAAFWPEGKGNVGSDAQVGSNHTGRAPDQEIWPGEGTFFGLGVNVKFPADFSRGPYSVLASGITTLPQKCAFPFSLITQPRFYPTNVPPAFNQILPGWVLSDSLYTLRRNERKFKTRNRARRTPLEADIFRPDMVDLMRQACRRLECVKPPREFYTDQHIDGLGKNFLLESDRLPALATYRFHLRWYALLGLKDQVRTILEEGRRDLLSRLLTTPARDDAWEQQRQILRCDLGLDDILTGLRQLPEIVEQVARGVENSKEKDDIRGRQIIEDYADTHPPAAADPVVVETWAWARKIQEHTQQLIASLTESNHGNREGIQISGIDGAVWEISSLKKSATAPLPDTNHVTYP